MKKKKMILVIIVICFFVLLFHYEYVLHTTVKADLGNRKTEATEGDFMQGDTVVVCKDNTLRNFPVFWGSRVELYSISDKKRYVVADTKRLGQSLHDPVTICGDYIYYEESGKRIERVGKGFCRVNISSGEKEDLGEINYENYVIDGEVIYYKPNWREEDEFGIEKSIYRWDLKSGEKEKVASFEADPQRSDDEKFFDHMSMLGDCLVLHSSCEQEIVLYYLQEGRMEKLPLLQKGEELWDIIAKDEDTLIVLAEKSGMFLYNVQSGEREELLTASEIDLEAFERTRNEISINEKYEGLGYENGQIIFHAGEDILYSYDIEKDERRQLYDIGAEKEWADCEIKVSTSPNYIAAKVHFLSNYNDAEEEWLYIVDYNGKLEWKMQIG